ncbi:hypothetical protein PITCH_A680012 [uncultured Desulfobacterium sp.]|uniref:Uncharacterized protein n=1 Tax=uncultured Desulfobacterium sp. TaxID=201089 RepID=A0A445N1P4_9BACT|nr:hypothetical protein PITCH_A680012 [uncultured Desulfobacterium sp.]
MSSNSRQAHQGCNIGDYKDNSSGKCQGKGSAKGIRFILGDDVAATQAAGLSAWWDFGNAL